MTAVLLAYASVPIDGASLEKYTDLSEEDGTTLAPKYAPMFVRHGRYIRAKDADPCVNPAPTALRLGSDRYDKVPH